MYGLFDAFHRLEELNRDFDRVFGRGNGRGSWTGPRFPVSAFLPGRSARGYPLVNISDDSEAVYVDALAPGLDQRSLDVSVNGNRLTISGEKSALPDGLDPQAHHRSERSAGRFVRTIEIPERVQPDGASANYENGMLRVRLKKSVEAASRQIPVQSSTS